MTTPEPYDRAARRAADNTSTATDHDGEWDQVDDIVRAVYPDPKVAAANADNAIVAEKRDLAAQDRAGDTEQAPAKTAKPADKTTKA